MWRTILLLATLISMTLAENYIECKENEVSNKSCESACNYDKYFENISKSPCKCKRDYARNHEGNCVPLKDCWKSCETNERMMWKYLEHTNSTKCVVMCHCNNSILINKKCVSLNEVSRPTNHKIFKRDTEKKCSKCHCNQDKKNSSKKCQSKCKNKCDCKKHGKHKCDYNWADCKKGTRYCKGECVNTNCTNGTVFNKYTCQCECDINEFKCNGKCVNIDCDVGVFDYENCSCKLNQTQFDNQTDSEYIFVIDPVYQDQCCQPNESPTDASSLLDTELTCQGTRNLPNITTSRVCVCAPGFTRDNITNYCLVTCPVLGENETYERFEYVGRERYCGNHQQDEFYRTGYFCEPGYGRNSSGYCNKCS